MCACIRQFAFPNACPIGIRRPNAAHAQPDPNASAASRAKEKMTYANPRWGGIILNPDDGYILRAGDEVLVVAEDDDTYEAEAPARPPAAELPQWSLPQKTNDNVLLLGWRRDLYDMLQELDKYVQRGCNVTVLAPVAVDERQALLEAGKAGPLRLRNIELHHVCGSTTYRRDVEAVMRTHVFSSVLVLAVEGGGGARTTSSSSASDADSRALTTLLLVRDIRESFEQVHRSGHGERAGSPPAQSEDFTLLGEILDAETKDLVAAAGVSDVIMSNRLMSKVMAMVAEADAVGPLFEQLFAEEGDEIYVRDIRYYCAPGEQLSFWELASLARVRGDIAIGYKRGSNEAVLNPAVKDARILWSEGDYLIVLGDDNPDDDDDDA